MAGAHAGYAGRNGTLGRADGTITPSSAAKNAIKGLTKEDLIKIVNEIEAQRYPNNKSNDKGVGKDD